MEDFLLHEMRDIGQRYKFSHVDKLVISPHVGIFYAEDYFLQYST